MSVVSSDNSKRIAYNARWVLPIASAPIGNGAVVVVGDQIAWVGHATNAVADEHVQLGNAALLPGLVNAHTHLELTALRGFLEALDFRDWLRAITDVRRDILTSDDLRDASTYGIHEGLLNGITTYADTTASAIPLDAMRNTGVRGIGFIETFGPDKSQVEASMSELQRSVEQHRANDTALVRTGVSPHAPYTVSRELFAAVARYAISEALPLAVHIAESEAEVAFVHDGTGPFAERLRARSMEVAATGLTPIALLDTCGILDARPLLIHAIQLNEDDLARIANSDSRIAHCPISNAKLGQGIAQLDRMFAHNIATGLGTDSVASNDRMDILGEARHATLLQALVHRQPDALSAHDALALATIGGARALGLQSQVGTLEVGKQADMVAFPLDRVEAAPLYDPAVTLVHALAGAVTASLVLVAGVTRVSNGRVLSADTGLRDRIESIGTRLAVRRL